MAEETQVLLAEELEALQGILNSQRENEQKVFNAVVGIYNLEQEKLKGFKALEENQKGLEELTETFREKYGDVNINAHTGEITAQEESQVE